MGHTIYTGHVSKTDIVIALMRYDVSYINGICKYRYLFDKLFSQI